MRLRDEILLGGPPGCWINGKTRFFRAGLRVCWMRGGKRKKYAGIGTLGRVRRRMGRNVGVGGDLGMGMVENDHNFFFLESPGGEGVVSKKEDVLEGRTLLPFFFGISFLKKWFG